MIITGAPGTGKTAIIDALRARGLLGIAEPAREIIAEQRAIGGFGVWERDTRLFLELLLSRSIAQFKGSKILDNSSKSHPFSARTIFYDRGIPDCLAYAAMAGVKLSHFENAAYQYRYEAKVWILPPWEEIYECDDERQISFVDTCRFHDLLVEQYSRVGYELKEVERGSVKDRVDKITASLD
jgi:predicted ATPase